jgi:alcohol dehydrogenase
VEVPTVLGHEIVGVVEASGRPDIEAGTRVTWAMCVGCRGCRYCQLGLPQKCERLFKFGHEAGVALTGGLAGHCLLPAGTDIIPLPDSLPDEVAVLANCATATVAATLSGMNGGSVLVFGAGMLGLTAVGMATARGAAVIVCDREAGRLEMARAFGAGNKATPDTVDQVVREVTGGVGVDYIVELTGADQSVEAALRNVRIGGKVVLAGTVMPTAGVQMRPEMVVRRLLTITGVHNYVPEDLREAVEFLATTKLPFAELVGAKFPLSRAEEAFQHALSGKAFRVAVVPG